MKTLSILGASGHGNVIADAARTTGVWKEIVFFDDAWPLKRKIGQSDIIGCSKSMLALDPNKTDVFVAIGNNAIRLSKQRALEQAGYSVASVVHSAAIVSDTAILGRGVVVMAGAVVNAGAVLGCSVIVNSLAVVEHDCILADGVHISPGACLAGGVKVGELSWVGIGASIIQLKTVGKNVTIGANAAVVTDIPDDVVAVGVPAKVIRHLCD